MVFSFSVIPVTFHPAMNYRAIFEKSLWDSFFVVIILQLIFYLSLMFPDQFMIYTMGFIFKFYSQNLTVYF